MSTDRLRILHTESSGGWGGQEIRILTEAQGMLERGHDVTLVTPPSAAIYEAARKRGIPTLGVPIGKKRVSSLAAMIGCLRKHRAHVDVINTHSSTDAWLMAAAGLWLKGLPPVVRTRHISTPTRDNRATRWLYGRATAHVVTTGEALRRELARANRLPLEHVTSVRTGIDLQRFKPMERAACEARLGLDSRPRLGIVATLRDWKGHDYLLDAWKLLRERFPRIAADWQLLVIGDGPRRAHLEARVAAEGLDGRVRFVGNQEDVPPWLNVLDLFVLPSYRSEGVPQSVMQAMACGLAVVSTPIGAIEEAVQRGRTGLIVPPKDAAALAEALVALMGDEPRRRAMGAAGLDYARANFTIDEMLDRMEAVFRAAASRRATR